jgi:hypothetical protein
VSREVEAAQSDAEYERRLSLKTLLHAAEQLVLHAANQAATFDGELEDQCDRVVAHIREVRGV